MIRVAALIIAVPLLIAPAARAESRAEITGGTPSQVAAVNRLLQQNRMPDPTPDLEVIFGACPDPALADDAGCTRLTHDSPIWLEPMQFSPFVLYHEMGHVFQTEILTAGPAHRFMTIMRYKQWTPMITERFADAYAACALDQVPVVSRDADVVDENFPTGYQYAPTPRQHRQVCGLIVRAAFTPA